MHFRFSTTTSAISLPDYSICRFNSRHICRAPFTPACSTIQAGWLFLFLRGIVFRALIFLAVAPSARRHLLSSSIASEYYSDIGLPTWNRFCCFMSLLISLGFFHKCSRFSIINYSNSSSNNKRKFIPTSAPIDGREVTKQKTPTIGAFCVPRGTRTLDPLIKSQLLYQLS